MHEEKTIRNDKLKKDLLVRLNKIEGQVKGIKNMVDKDCYCDDIFTQISAVKSAINSCSKILLENHIRTCVVSKIKDDDDEIIDELIKTLGRLL